METALFWWGIVSPDELPKKNPIELEGINAL